MSRNLVLVSLHVVCKRTLAAAVLAAKAMTLAAVAAHFVLVTVSVLPENPLRLQLDPLVTLTVARYAPQNWRLFAPDPVQSDQAMLVRCLTQREFHNGSWVIAGDNWFDVSLPFWTQFQENRFSAYDRLVRPQTNTLRMHASGGIQLVPWKDACEIKSDQQACDFYKTRMEVVRSETGKTLRKLGSAFCNELSHTATEPTFAVALRARYTHAHPWSKRTQSQIERRTEDLELGVYPVDETIRPAGLFRRALAQ